MLAAFAVVVAYLLGSIPFGVLLARTFGIELRRIGSGNIGATNAARALGRGWGAVVLLLDAGKATVPILLWRAVLPAGPRRGWVLAAVGAAALVGHVFPLFLRFRGGKGVATTFGALLALEPWAALLGGLAYGVAFALTRISSVGSLCAAAIFPLFLWLCHATAPNWCFTALALVLILWRHRGNIERLLRRQERGV